MKKSPLFFRTGLSLSGILLILSCNTNRQQSGELPLKPNILICIADDASHMSAYGYSWIKTPGFDRVAQEGILFTNAYTPNAKCAPSRSCILTGRNSWQLEEAANHWCYFPEKFKTFFETLKENGYYTGFTGKGWAPGVAGKINGKPRMLTGDAYQEMKINPPAECISNVDYAENFRSFLKNKPEDKPFCFWYGAHEPHRSYEFKAGIRKGRKKLSDIDSVYSFWPDIDSVRTDILDYAFEVEYFDQHLQKILIILEEQNKLDNTLVIATSDHGMPFPRVKGQAYKYSNHVPLSIMWKNRIEASGRVVDDYVSFIDIAPTILELSQINEKQSGMQSIEGKSLTDIFYSDRSGIINTERDHVLIGKERHDIGRPADIGYPIRGIIKDGYLYIHNFKTERWPGGNPETGYLNCDGSPTKTVILEEHRKLKNVHYWKWSFGKRPEEELYNIDNDPDCINNLANRPQYQERKDTLKVQLFNELKEQDDPRMFGKGDIFDGYPYADTKDTAFYERYIRGEKLPAGWVNKSDFEKKPIQSPD